MKARSNITYSKEGTEKSILFFGIFVFILIYIGVGALIHLLYLETGSMLGTSITGIISFLILLYFTLLLFKGSIAKKENTIICLENKQNNALWKIYKNDKNFFNHHNYYSSVFLKTEFFKKYRRKIIRTFLKSICIYTTLIFLPYFILIYLPLSAEGFSQEILNILAPILVIMFFITIAFIISLGKTHRLYYRSLKGTKYHKSGNKVFFY